MEKAVFFILISCGILSQGICNVYQKNNKNSSDLLIRNKRVSGGIPLPLEAAPYLVHVLENENYLGPATLLTADVAISSAAWFINRNPHNLRVLSRSAAGTQHHEVIGVIFLDPSFDVRRRTLNNLALVRFVQPIHFETSHNRAIPIYTGNLAADHSIGSVVSWGRSRNIENRKVASDKIRSISVTMISFEYCQEYYPNIIHLGNICAIRTVPQDFCDNRDSGVPLIMRNQLLGIFVYCGHTPQPNPNVFMNLLDNGIRRWIHEHVPSLHLF